MKRTFRYCAVIAGLIERRFPGQEKRSRQITMSTDLVYDVLRRHEPDHILLKAARADAATGLLDIKRLSEMLSRIRGESSISRCRALRRSRCRCCSRSGARRSMARLPMRSSKRPRRR